jgi:hypothetical protein
MLFREIIVLCWHKRLHSCTTDRILRVRYVGWPFGTILNTTLKRRVLYRARDSYHNVHIKLFKQITHGDPSRMEMHRNVYAMLEDMNFFL